MRPTARHQWIIAAAAGLVFFTNLGGPRLWDDDEPRNATCAREMLARGDWVVPTFNGELRTDKPVLLYWLIMGTYQVFGDNEFSVRFWSAFSALGTVLCTYHLGRILFRAEVGLWGALALTTALWFGFTGRAATPDSLLILCSTFALLWFVKSSFANELTAREEESVRSPAFRRNPSAHSLPPEGGTTNGMFSKILLPPRWRDFAIMYAAIGFGVLAKGPIGVLLPGAVLTIYLLWMKNIPDATDSSPTSLWGVFDAALVFLRRMTKPRNVLQAVWALRPITGLLVVGAIALPWYIAVGIQTHGAWLAGFFMNHNLQRFAGSLNGHRGTVFYYIPTILAGFFPWSIFLPLSLWRPVQRVYNGDSRRRSYVLLISWLGLYVGFFTIAGTKLPSYVLPAYPALAVLVGAFLEQWFARPGAERKFWMRTAFVTLAAAGAAGLIGLPIASSKLLPGERLIGLLGLIPLVGGLTALVLLELRQFRRAILTMATTAVLLATIVFGFVAVRIGQFQNTERFVAAARKHAGDEVRLAGFQIFPSSLVYYAGRPVEYLEDTTQLKEFFAREPNGCLFITWNAFWAIKETLPADIMLVDRQQRFLREEEVMLLSRPVAVARKGGGAQKK